MTFTPITPGTSNWDVPLNAGLLDIQAQAVAAQSSANAAQTTANTAETDAQTGITNAAAANTAAMTAQSTANAAQGTANTAVSNAAAAQSTANSAQTTASAALPKTGGTMSGAINMGSSQINSLANGSAASDAAAFGQIPTAGTGSTNFTVGNDPRLLQAYGSGAPAQGFISWNYDPESASSTNSLTSGTIWMHKIYIPASTVNSIGLTVSTAGSGLTAGQNLVGLYTLAGSKLGQSVDQTSFWNSTGFKNCALSAPVVISTSGYYYVAVLSVGTTAPISTSSNGLQSTFNANTSGATLRHASALTGQTTLPSSITTSSNTSTGTSTWVTVF